MIGTAKRPDPRLCRHERMGAWTTNGAILDMLVRRCQDCGVRDVRILPPDVSGHGVKQYREATPWYDENLVDEGGEA